MATYAELFRAATGHDPYPYQTVFATRQDLPALLSIPTGCGKTAAVVLDWLWRRRFASAEGRGGSYNPAWAASAPWPNVVEVAVLGRAPQQTACFCSRDCAMQPPC